MPITERQVVEALPRRGFLWDYVRYASARTDSHVAFHVACGLALLSQTAPDTLLLPFGTKTIPNLYVLLVGLSREARKTEAIKVAQDLIEDALPDAVAERPGSPEGLIETLRDRPQRIIFYPEFGDFLSSVERGYLTPLKSKFVEAYDGTPLGRRTVTGQRARTKDGKVNQEVKHPRLSLLCGCAQDFLERYTEEVDWTGGFLGRYFMLALERERFYKTTPKADFTTKARLSSVLTAYYLSKTGFGIIQQCSGLDPAVEPIWEEWVDSIQRHKNTPIRASRSSIGEAATIALKIAYLIEWDIGAARDYGTWSIGREALEAAIKITNIHVDSSLRIGGSIAPDRDMKDRRKVLAQIKADPTDYAEILKGAQLSARRGREMIQTLLAEKTIVRCPATLGDPSEYYALSGYIVPMTDLEGVFSKLGG